MTSTNDPTAHAEVNAIRAACAAVQEYHLTGCDIYASCEPCPMCLGAIYWAQMRRIFYAATRADAAAAGFDDAVIYLDLAKNPTERRIPTMPLLHPAATEPFQAWRKYPVRQEY